MNEALRFESLLTDLSMRLSAASMDELDAAIDGTLIQLFEFLGTDRASLIELLPGADSAALTHSRARPGVVAATANATVIPPSANPYAWYRDQLTRGKTLRFDRLPDELPESATAERAYAAALPMLSHVAVPLSVGGRWVGALLTATAKTYRSWNDRDVERIRIVGQILANALHRRHVERELRAALAEVRELQQRLEAENEYLREANEINADFEQVVGRSASLRKVLEQVSLVAPMSTPVLLLGETGTGKELLARAIHTRSKRSERPLVKVNCAAIPSSLVESELFGHEKGAFTGATSSKPGRFEVADGGTLFLDEVGELPLEIQAKLLRVLQDGEFERLGSNTTRHVDVRIIAATNRNLERGRAEGTFREDLYYRLSTFPIRVPPLRERREDIPLLVWDWIQRRRGELDRHIERVPERAMEELVRYPWPGNVRELGNVIERAMILSVGPVLQLDGVFDPAAMPAADAAERLDQVERAHFEQVLERCGWRINGTGNAAEILGMHPNTLRSRLKKLGVARPPAATRAPH